MKHMASWRKDIVLVGSPGLLRSIVSCNRAIAELVCCALSIVCYARSILNIDDQPSALFTS